MDHKSVRFNQQVPIAAIVVVCAAEPWLRAGSKFEFTSKAGEQCTQYSTPPGLCDSSNNRTGDYKFWYTAEL